MCIAVVVFAATPPAANGQSTETEPNNVFIERNLFGPAVSQVDGFLDFGGDVDFLSFTDRQPGSPFTAEIISADFDTILGEFDDGGFLLGMDDDGGVGLLSRLDGTIAPSGDLNLAVSGFNDFGFTGSHGQSGNYSLALTSTTTGGGIAATFTNVDNRVGGPGSPANTILTFDHPGGPALNGIGFSGTLNNLGSGTFPADAQILITSPFGFDTIFQPSDQGGSFASPLNLTGTINDFDGIDPAGTWTFEFWDNFDDFGGGDGGLIDSRWDTVSFDFGGSAPPPASPKFFWIGGSSGLSIQDPANWIDESSNPGVPGPTDTAVFNQDFGFTVFANAFSPTTIGGLEVTSPDRHILRLNAPLTVEGEVVIDKQGTAPLQIEGPASLSASLVRVFSGIFEVDSTSLQVLSSGFTDDDTGILQIGDAVAPGDFTRVEIFPGASVTVERQVQIGRSGNGELLIRSGANLTVDSSFVGDNSHGNVFVGIGDPGGNGQLFVQGDLTSAAQINLGRSEGTSGTMTIGSTGTVQSGKAGSPTGSSGIIGSLGPGTVLVDGGFWTQDGALSVGFGDVGEMTIQDGGFVESLEGFIGRNPGSQGSVLIDGADGDFWHVIESLYVGGNADGAAGTVALLQVNGLGVVEVGQSLVNWDTGQVEGDGTIRGNFVNHGQVAPGTSPGALFVDGDFTQEAGGSLLIELAGLTPATQHDVLRVSGTAALAGLIEIALIDGFVPLAGDSFTIMEFDTLIDDGYAFDFTNAGLDEGLFWDSGAFSETGTIRIIPEPASLALLGLGGLALLRRTNNRTGR